MVFLAVMIAGVGAGLIGFVAAQNEPRIVQKTPEPTSSALPAGAENARIAPDAKVHWHYTYERCAHRVLVECNVDESMVGLTFTEFSQRYPYIKIIEFDSDKLVLSRSYDTYCPEHYILKKNGNELAIYRTAVGSGKQEVYLKVPIDFNEIAPDERKVLEAGRVFSSISDLESYLEDIET